MSFNQSMSDNRNLEIVEGHILRVHLRNGNGEDSQSDLDLNTCLGNDNGVLVWGGQNFSGSAEDVRVGWEAEQPILRCRLRNNNGEMQDADKNLTEYIGNNNGQLYFVQDR